MPLQQVSQELLAQLLDQLFGQREPGQLKSLVLQVWANLIVLALHMRTYCNLLQAWPQMQRQAVRVLRSAQPWHLFTQALCPSVEGLLMLFPSVLLTFGQPKRRLALSSCPIPTACLEVLTYPSSHHRPRFSSLRPRVSWANSELAPSLTAQEQQIDQALSLAALSKHCLVLDIIIL